MKNNKDFDFIKNEFENENITAPYVLNEEFVINKLASANQKKIKFYRSKTFKSIVSMAACVVLVVTVLTTAMPHMSYEKPTVNNSQANENTALLGSFASIDDIKSAVSKIESEQLSIYSNEASKTAWGTAESISETAMDSSFGTTYKQVDAVDEADIIKNNGKNIFFVGQSENIVKIYEPSGDDTVLVSQIEFSTDKIENSADEYIRDIFVYNDNLIVNSFKFICKDDSGYLEEVSLAHIYDISNASNPKEINTFSQSGSYISSRMIGSQLYFLSQDLIWSNECKEDSDYIPYTKDGNDEKRSLPLNDIAYAGDSDSASYIVISTINAETAERSTETKAFFGAGTDVYCNENNMYITVSDFQCKSIDYSMAINRAETKTTLVKVQLSPSGIIFSAVCELDGDVNNQFSMDEKDGNLRVATTSVKDGKDTNNLFVLDENLNIIGRLTGFADNESIKSVRFIGDTAYVITYKDIDPLFVIDLSNPAQPQIKGEVEITGFSSLLVPVDKNILLGIGCSTKQGEHGESADGLKLVLFDISNPENPAVMDSYVMDDAYSEAQYNHKALVVNPDKGYYAIPYEKYNEQYFDNEQGAITFTVENGKINLTNKFVINSKGYETRCTYIDNRMYIFNYSGYVDSFEVN